VENQRREDEGNQTAISSPLKQNKPFLKRSLTMHKKVELVYLPDHQITKMLDDQVYQEYLKKDQTLDARQRYSDEETDFIRNAVPDLPEKERVVIHLSFWENYCDYEIAHHLKISVKQVLRLKESALQRLKENYHYYFGCPTVEGNRLVS